MDHVSYACEHDGLAATTERIATALGVEAVKGGVHPRFGTRNMIIPLAGHKYLEVVEVLDHPASDKAPLNSRRIDRKSLVNIVHEDRTIVTFVGLQ